MGEMSSAVWILVGILFISPFYEASKVEDDSVGGRQRRSIVTLENMVKAVTGREGTDFLNYGNWCGLGGEGRPLDPIDECCQNHDMCYDVAKKSVCSSTGDAGIYYLQYNWRVAGDQTAVCEEEEDQCKMTICICDAIISNCLKSNIGFYNPENFKPIDVKQVVEDVLSLSKG